MSGNFDHHKQQQGGNVKRGGNFIIEFGLNESSNKHYTKSDTKTHSLIKCPRGNIATGSGIQREAADSR